MWRRFLLPIALALALTGCAIPQYQVPQTPETPTLRPGGQYVFIFGCYAALGCSGEVVTVEATMYNGWVKLADGRIINLRLVLAIQPYEPPSEPPEESSPALRVKL